MKYLKKFENHTAYTNAESELILPNVSYCVQENEVHYNPIVLPLINGHMYVDLGLPSGTKWATMNIGASSETDYGNYYQYGKGSAQYAATSGQSAYNKTENPLAASADTATQTWGDEWHMPTLAQIKELTANTSSQWVTNYNGSGVNGRKFTAQNGNVLFLPACGSYYSGTLSSLNTYGYYWGSGYATSTNPEYSLSFDNYAYDLYFSSSYCLDQYSKYKTGLPIRPVSD